jgi:hypothetical protein
MEASRRCGVSSAPGWNFTARHIPWLRYARTTDAADLVQAASGQPRPGDGTTDRRLNSRPIADTDVQVRLPHRWSAVQARATWPGVELLHQHRRDRYDLYILRMKAGVARVEFAPQEENHPRSWTDWCTETR